MGVIRGVWHGGAFRHTCCCPRAQLPARAAARAVLVPGRAGEPEPGRHRIRPRPGRDLLGRQLDVRRLPPGVRERPEDRPAAPVRRPAEQRARFLAVGYHQRRGQWGCRLAVPVLPAPDQPCAAAGPGQRRHPGHPGRDPPGTGVRARRPGASLRPATGGRHRPGPPADSRLPGDHRGVLHRVPGHRQGGNVRRALGTAAARSTATWPPIATTSHRSPEHDATIAATSRPAPAAAGPAAGRHQAHAAGPAARWRAGRVHDHYRGARLGRRG